MVLPFKEKTWQYNVGTNIYNATSGVNNQNAIYAFKAALVGFGQNPWTVVGSSNRSVAGMDGVDRWIGQSSINLSNAVGSWIVLKQTGISSTFQILLTCSNLTNPMQISFSPVAGFTGGSITAFPTATDSVVVSGNSLNFRHAEGNAILNVMQTTDGYCTRAWMYINGTPGGTSWCFHAEKIKNPVQGLTRDYFVANWVDSNVSAWTQNAYRYDYIMGARFHATFSGNTDQVLQGTSEGLATVVNVDYFQCPNDISGEYQIYPISLANMDRTMGQYYGRWGEFYDLWMGSVSNDLFYFRDNFNSSKQFFQISNVIIPWNGTQAVLG